MRRSADGALFLRPAKRIEPQRWPVIHRIAAGRHLLPQTQQAEMAALVRTKSAYLDIVAQQIRIARHGIDLAREELFLVIKARSPRKIAPDLEVFAHDVP